MNNKKPKLQPRNKTYAAEAVRSFKKLDQQQTERIKKIAGHAAIFRHIPRSHFPYIDKHILPAWYDMKISTGFDADSDALAWLKKDIKNHISQLNLEETLILINSCLARECDADRWYKNGVTSALFYHLLDFKKELDEEFGDESSKRK